MDPFIPFPTPQISENPNAWDYFWFQLPYGVPGVISLIVGLFLSYFSFQRVLNQRGDDRIFAFNLFLSFFGYSILGLILSLRAWVLDKGTLLQLNNWLYLFVILILPTNFYICYSITRKKIFLYYTYLCWIAVVFGYVGILQGKGFVNEWFDYSFGSYPKASNYIKPFGVIPLIGYFTLVIPFFTLRWKELSGKIHRSLFIGYNILFIFTISNAPVLLGYNVYPGSFFIFIPLLLISYGVFRSDFFDVNELLFQKNGLFYILFGLVSLSLILLPGAVTLGMNHEAYNNQKWLPYAIPPALSFFCSIFMAIIVAGSNPSEKLNQLCAFSLIITAFYNLQSIPTKFSVDYIVMLRISQVCFLVFSLAPSILTRFVLKVIDSKRPPLLKLADIISVICASLSITPYLYNGYFVYEQSVIHKGYLVQYLLGLNASICFYIVFRELKIKWKSIPKLSIVVIGTITVSGLLLLTALLPSNGIYFPLLSDYQFIPTTVLGFAVLKYGAFSIKGRTIRFSQRLANLGILAILIASALQLPKFLEDFAIEESMFHLSLVTLPLILFNYLLVYVFARPLAEELDQNYLLLEEAKEKAEVANEVSERLLLNILPKKIAEEIKKKGFYEPETYEDVSILFTDFRGFTKVAETMDKKELITDLDACFTQFDEIVSRNKMEKLKTIGDSYMCAGGLPSANRTNALDACLAALEIRSFMDQMKEIKTSLGFPFWELRIGIHTGPVIAGVVGRFKFAYDIWGESVNTASRMESSGVVGEINISQATYDKICFLFDCEYRGKVEAKHKVTLDMYFVRRLKPKFSRDEQGFVPNDKFWKIYERIQNGAVLVKKPHSTSV
ncbi:MAG: adenylate/guanylate cyclase domain-containing protein [Leptospira sp.]|nr:adenylate/guanylate cyclase domain-containing protein [Leptospira sp.]